MKMNLYQWLIMDILGLLYNYIHIQTMLCILYLNSLYKGLIMKFSRLSLNTSDLYVRNYIAVFDVVDSLNEIYHIKTIIMW